MTGVAALRGFVVFFAAFGFELFALYGLSPQISTTPFVVTILANMGVKYFDFVFFWLWMVILPIEFWWFVIRPTADEVRRGGFHGRS